MQKHVPIIGAILLLSASAAMAQMRLGAMQPREHQTRYKAILQ